MNLVKITTILLLSFLSLAETARFQSGREEIPAEQN